LANTAVIEEEPWQSATWRLRLDLLIHGRGHYEAAWRHPVASPLPLTDIRYDTYSVTMGTGKLVPEHEVVAPTLTALIPGMASSATVLSPV
jgi:hypothetical protein